MICRRGQLTLRSYWDLQFPEVYDGHDEEYYIDKWTNLIKRAVTRQIGGPTPLAVSLSGGVDSRKLLALMERDQVPVLALTFGQPESDDVRLAREVAKALGVEYHFFRLPPDYLLHLAEEGVRLTDGMKSCAHMHGLGPLRQMAGNAQVFYLGYLGGTIHGDSVSPGLLAPFDESTMTDLLFRDRNKLFRVEEHKQLLVDSFYDQVRGQAYQSFRAALERSRSTWAADKNNYLEIEEVDRRFTSLGHELLRSQVAVRTPLADKDFLEFTMTVPPGLRQAKSFYFKAFGRVLPELAKIPYEGTGLPLVRCFRELSIRSNQQIRWWLRAKGLKLVPQWKHKPYADYDSWMRGVLRPWVEDTLLSERALGREYFNPDYVRDLVAEHMAGADYARKLGVLLSIELWHRLFLD
jgi:asparagine synthase (glutamine-hydrolysing)